MHTNVELEQQRWAEQRELTPVDVPEGCVEHLLDCVTSEGEGAGLRVHQLLFNMEDAGR